MTIWNVPQKQESTPGLISEDQSEKGFFKKGFIDHQDTQNNPDWVN